MLCLELEATKRESIDLIGLRQEDYFYCRPNFYGYGTRWSGLQRFWFEILQFSVGGSHTL